MWLKKALVFSILSMAYANFLIPGIMEEEVELTPNYQEYLGFIQSALNGTEVEIRVICKEDTDVTFNMQFVIRSSPCAKEFIVDRGRLGQINDLLAFYFDNDDKIPPGYDYNQIRYYKSKPQKIDCTNNHGSDVFFGDDILPPEMEVKQVSVEKEVVVPSNIEPSNIRRVKREFPGLNGNTIDGGAKRSLTSWHPVQKVPMDSIYLLIIKITVDGANPDVAKKHKVGLEVQWRGPHGYLSAIDYPLLRFYAFMCVFYMGLAMSWMYVCLKYWKDLLRIQFWIGVVIIIGLVEKAIFYAEYSNMNEFGRSVQGLIEAAELTSCAKRTMAHVLVIVVSVGYGVVKPRLGTTLNQVTAVGILYFIFCAIEGLSRVSKASIDSMKEKQFAKIPLALLEIIIAYWIFTSLVNTMRALRMRRNEVKLNLYRHFTNTLALALGVAVMYMMWSVYIHLFQYCMKDWKELWVDTAFWHIFFITILVVIMFLWRPSQNNQRYAFTPLLDNSEDENEDDEIFNSQAPVFDMVKSRTSEREKLNRKENKDEKLEEDLKWIENNIPSSLVEALIDEEEEQEQKQLEFSKML